MATLWKTGNGNGVGPSSINFYAVCQIGYSGSYAGGYNVQCRRYVYVSSGQSSNFTSNLTVSWSSTKYALSSAGTYADTGWVNLGNYAYGTTPSISAYCYYTGGSGTTYRSDASVSYTVPYQNYTHTINHYFIGFNGETGTLSGYPNHYTLATTSVTITRGKSIIHSSYATTVPYASYLRSVNSGAGTGISPSTTYTQGTGSEPWNYYYYPYEYDLTYDLDGGSVVTANPSQYNILYGHTINQPTKSGHQFLGWNVEKEKLTYTAGGTSNWNYVRLYENCEPGITYTITMENARVTSGSASQFTTFIYDFTDAVSLVSATTNFGTNRSYTITCPKTANPTHELVLIVYSAIAGSTANIYSSFDGTVIKYFSAISTYVFDINSVTYQLDTGLNSTTGAVTAASGYAVTSDLIPIEPGTVLYSNKIVCGIYTYDSSGTFIKRESSYSYLHPISSTAAYIRIEVWLYGEGQSYLDTLIINNEMGINKGLNAEFANVSTMYSELRKRTSGAWIFTATWKPIIPQNIYLCKDGSIYARNFIESDDFYFTKDGDIYAPSFIVGNKIGFSPTGLIAAAFIEGIPYDLMTLIDENGDTLVDENGNILEAYV